MKFFMFSTHEIKYTRSVPGNHKDVGYFVNSSLKFKDIFMLLNHICTYQTVKILVQSFTNCKSYGDLYDGVSAFTEHVENNFATFMWRGG